jgi:hypothetical protein
LRKPIIAGIAFGLALAATAALAQIVSYKGSPYIPLATGTEGYQIVPSASISGTSVTFQRGQSEMVVTGTSTITTATINLAPPLFSYDGLKNCFYTKPAITTLTLQATAPQTLNDAVTSTSATTRYCYIFSASNNSWNRLQ